jgi:predicted nucleic acid-binding protein
VIVVDTNVVAYLLLPGGHTAAAEAVFQRDSDWLVPPLWRSELRNTLALQIRRHGLTLEKATGTYLQASALLVDGEVDVSPGLVLELAARSGCTAYDCEFVALAQAQAVPLVTADAQILREFPGIAVSMEAFARG